MKRDHSEGEDDDEDQDIDYGNILEQNCAPVTESVPLVSMDLPEGVDLNLTRGDFHNSEILYAYKRMASFLAIALFVEHHEPMQRGEFCFGQEIQEEDKQEDVFFPPVSQKPPKLHL
jgi:hypothetical protein